MKRNRIFFGYLPRKVSIQFNHGTIRPIDEFDAVVKAISKLFMEDGYLYPPTRWDSMVGKSGRLRRNPRTKRPAHLYRLPPTHEMELDINQHDIREKSAGFLLHLLEFMTETRLQFADWYLDGRVKAISSHGDLLLRYPEQFGYQLSVSFDFWASCPEKIRAKLISTLQMFSRDCIYEWDWEQFLIQYMVLDSCWSIGATLFGFKKKKHDERAAEIYGRFGIKDDRFPDFKLISRLRNNLIHELTWADGRPGHARLTAIGFCPGTALWALNRRLLAHLLGIYL